MKFSKIISFIALAVMFTTGLQAQVRSEMQFYRYNDQRGLNVFETPKTDTVPFNGVAVRVGGDFAIQFQALSQSNAEDSLVELGQDFNLPTANLNLDVQLYDGVRMHLRTYLSSRHHAEAWVKGGYLQIDKLDFIKEGFASGFMDMATIKFGLDQFSYGDAVFRRSDNANAIYNPFVGNYIMDSFSTEPFGEITIQKSGFLAVVGATNGKLNQNVVVNDNSDNQPSLYGKLGYDDQVTEDLRVRLTGSVYANQGETTGFWLYGGDRAGSRYYHVMEDINDGGSDFDGRFNPRFRQMTAIQVNPFVKFHGLEFFGIYENVSDAKDGGEFTQIGAELIYRIGEKEDFYIGGRYNNVTGKDTEDAMEKTIDRINAGAGWFMTKNILAKAEYVMQTYSGDGWAGTRFDEGEFSGVVVEAVISF
ncbi:hypothetical protein [Halocola ammonii]